jgi:hypothetical protein
MNVPIVGKISTLRDGCQPSRAPISNRRAGWLPAPLLVLLAAVALGQTPAPQIAANDLKADVSFLASDALEGRATPSKGLDIAAEFIASQFRRAGLEPAGDDGYFQTAAFETVKPNTDGLAVTLDIGGKKIAVDKGSMAINQASAATVDDAPLTRGAGRGVVSLTSPGITIQVSGRAPRGAPLREASAPGPVAPTVVVWDAAVRDALAAAPNAEVKVTARIPAPVSEQVKLHNVAGILRGSDAALKDTYLILTAHYDHLGVRPDGEGDRIFNGANDDASGTASLMEIAHALTALPAKPKRSIVFVALFGEEIGEIGSLYYVRHPLFPLAKTIADINLEQLGRTDDSERPKVLEFNLTGFGYTTLGATFQKAAEEAGVRAVNDEPNGDSYFARSDNARFADAGVPDTTISVAYMFPDYHAVGDEWPKLDYENMAKVDRAVALAALDLANSGAAPQWNAADARTARYIKARQADK